MPDQVTPIAPLDSIGLIKDVPPVALPPNAFTDALNVRFRHGAVKKMSGEKTIPEITPTYLGHSDGEFIFVTEWANPNLSNDNTYYIVVVRDTSIMEDHVYLIKAYPLDIANPEYTEIGTTSNLGVWQETLFQGGYAIILNNGVDIPYYLMDTEAGTAFANFALKPLPNWDSYYGVEKLIDVTRDFKETGNPDTGPILSVGSLIDFTTDKLLVEAYDVLGALRGSITVTANGTYSHGGQSALYVATDAVTNTTTCTPEYDSTVSNSYIDDGERFVVYRQSLNPLDIRANLIKSFGDLLIAGGLRVVDTSTGGTIKRLPGLIRTSNVATPGSLPTNWNPFASSANTADEIQLASSGEIRDMVPLQNQMIIYTDRSIHGLSKTNNPTVPFSVTNITSQYGALTLDSVIEYDGRHLVVGNNDIYLFGGNPGSIQSVSEGKVRDFFYEDMNQENVDAMFVFRNKSKDEIWINYPSGAAMYPDKSLIWNYKTNAWTLRRMSEMRSGFPGHIAEYLLIDGGDADTSGSGAPADVFVSTAAGGDADDPITDVIDASDASPLNYQATRVYPIFCDSVHLYFAEADDVYVTHEGHTYESRIARRELPLSPEFDTEHLKSVVLWTSRDGTSDIDLSVFMQTHNVPTGDEVLFNMNQEYVFTIGQDYKVDVRAKGRFFDYIITDKPLSSSAGIGVYWAVSGLQTMVTKGGAR